ncbi:MAG: tRNA preQ1(34) S-adenosylmethionine ribosyltransferase-isomerase QueA [Candidatus Omnitrophota bacterium]|jgi:S-adenosylmethionine:tRNA ribosyltransferase-isomerase|nr:MAG: tRNA preQ1(34) S-adenosylmethionine ribosyltransferase-isomerase QueA [Candidatus Omnitrophota bacterium]
MKLSDFDYTLPKDLIAQHPLRERSGANLLVLNRKEETIEHRKFSDIAEYITEDDFLFLNDTKVLPCRIIGHKKTGGRVELLLLKQKEGPVFECLVKPARLKCGQEVIFDSGKISARISANNEVSFSTADIPSIYSLGVMPLPPYIKRQVSDSDSEYYQTIYARVPGSVASPTAGLHFTSGLLDKLKDNGVKIGYLTLHVGLATFKPVKSQDVVTHKMHEEYFFIPEGTIRMIDDAQRSRKNIIAVGTTTLRSIESYGQTLQSSGKTSLFIYPGYKFRYVNSMITNFHLPKTTLFILVSAFAGEKLIKKAYQEAIDRKYRFYSYGDAMLII